MPTANFENLYFYSRCVIRDFNLNQLSEPAGRYCGCLEMWCSHNATTLSDFSSGAYLSKDPDQNKLDHGTSKVHEVTWITVPGPVSRKPLKLFGPVKPFFVHLHVKMETYIRLKLLA